MHWIIQDNLIGEESYYNFIESFDKLDVSYTQVKIVPFTDKLVNLDFDHKTQSWEEAEEPLIDTSLPLFPYGSTTLNRISNKRGWKPGSFMNDNFDFSKWRENLGAQYLLNGDSVVCTINESLSINLPEHLFVRPTLDTKSFCGTRHSKDQYLYWANQISKIEEDPSDRNAAILHKNTEVTVAPQKDIKAEYRFFVVNGKVVTGSIYRLGYRVLYDVTYVDRKAIEFAQDMVNMWQPSVGFVIDIADIGVDSYKVIEYNTINISGLYASDPVKFITAIEEIKYVD